MGVEVEMFDGVVIFVAGWLASDIPNDASFEARRRSVATLRNIRCDEHDENDEYK